MILLFLLMWHIDKTSRAEVIHTILVSKILTEFAPYVIIMAKLWFFYQKHGHPNFNRRKSVISNDGTDTTKPWGEIEVASSTSNNDPISCSNK